MKLEKFIYFFIKKFLPHSVSDKYSVNYVYKKIIKHNFIGQLSTILNADASRAIIFDFTGGLADQAVFFSYALQMYKSGLLRDKQIYFNIGNLEKKWGGYKLFPFNLNTIMNFNIIFLSKPQIKLFNDIGNYSYHARLCSDSMEPELGLGSNVMVCPMIIKHRGTLFNNFEYVPEFKQAMQLTVPLDEKNLEMLEKIRGTESVCVHIRRSDFVGHIQRYGWLLGTVSAKYINQKISQISDQIKNAEFFVFSQDFEWVKNNVNFGKSKYEFVTFNDDHHAEYELELMKNCKHFILSCGGFARLAAFLSESPNKIIFRPNRKNKFDWEIFEYNPFSHKNIMAGFRRNFIYLRKKIYANYLIIKMKLFF